MRHHIIHRYTGLRGDKHAKVAKAHLVAGKYYYVAISRKTQLKYEFVAEYLGTDFKNRPTFAYQSAISNQEYKWHTRSSDEFYDLVPDTPLPAELLDDIRTWTKKEVPSPSRRCCIM